VVPMEARPSSTEGRGEVTQRDLVRNALRMRPDRIIVGEVRGPEAFDMMQAMNTGHDGSLTTVHANSPRDALGRIENMVLMAGFDLPIAAIREQMASALHVVIQLARHSDGRRRVVHLTEVAGLEGSLVTLQDIFTFKQRGIDSDGMVVGSLQPTGIRPRFADRLAAQDQNLQRRPVRVLGGLCGHADAVAGADFTLRLPAIANDESMAATHVGQALAGCQ